VPLIVTPYVVKLWVLPPVIFIFSRNETFKRTVLVHRVLLWSIQAIAETYKVLWLVFGKETISRTQAFEWFSKFINGLTSLHNTQCSVCPATHKVDDCDAYQGTCLQKHVCLSQGGSLIWIMLKHDWRRIEEN